MASLEETIRYDQLKVREALIVLSRGRASSCPPLASSIKDPHALAHHVAHLWHADEAMREAIGILQQQVNPDVHSNSPQ